MDLLLSIDPGKNYVGLAVWDPEEKALLDARSMRIASAQDHRRMYAWRQVAIEVNETLQQMVEIFGVGDVAYEYFRVYDHDVGKQDDVLQLAGVVGAISTSKLLPNRHDDYHGYEPGKWTRGRAKPANQLRIWRRLDDEEREAFEGIDGDELGVRLDAAIDSHSSHAGPGQHEHAVDAVGVGLYHLRRL